MSTVTIDRGALDRLLQRGGVARDLMQRGDRVAERQQQLAPRESGRLAAAIAPRLRRDDDGIFCDVGPWGVWYAWFPEFGTFEQPAEPFIRPSLEAAR
jgi:HK97 gp10 family phage protein